MRAWRIFNDVHDGPPAHPLEGEESRRSSGRWHHRGTRVVYASSSTGLALLEVLAHLEADDPDAQVLATIDLPDDAVELLSDDAYDELLRGAPEDDDDAQRPTRDFGTRWAREGRSVALVTPSVIVPYDTNVILNPLHPRASEVRLVCCEPITIDPRLRRVR